MASTYLTRTPSSASNRKTFTFSAWVKPSSTTSGVLFSCGTDISNGPLFTINFRSDTNIRVEDTISGGTQPINLRTSRLFRDHNAWYHLMVAVDTTQGTASDRVKIYVNGEQETSFTSATYPNQNIDTSVNNNHIHAIGARSTSQSGTYYNGSMSHVHFCDGTALAPTVFGSTDSTTGEWKINTSPSFTPGTNGFTILKDGNTITDQSANSNNWTLAGGTLTKTEDNPSNVFATMNPLHFNSSSETFSNGNNTLVSTGGGSWTTHFGFSTLAMGSGKYYIEMKADNTGTSAQSYPIGLIDVEQNITSSLQDNGVASIRASTGNITGGGSNLQTGLTAISAGDILAMAYDGVNGTVQFYRNGSTHGTAVTGIDTSKDYYVACDTYEGSSNFKYNFGNGYFGTTAVSSAGTNASGIGIFEYDVPTGFTALSTKGLNL